MTSAKPLNLAISLNLSSSSSSSIHTRSHPAPPSDWQKKWFRQHQHLQSHPQSSTSTSTPSDSDSSSSSSYSSSSDPWQQEPGSRKAKRRKWVTCLSDWNQGKGKEISDHLPHISISSSSSPTRESDETTPRSITSDDRRARLGGRPGGRIALGLADGTVWLLASQKASHNGKGKAKDDSSDQDLSEKFDREIDFKNNNQNQTPPSINTSHSPNTRSSRAHSPTPSTHSNSRVSSSNHHRRTGESLSISSHAPPFVGFGSPVSPTAPTSSTSQSTNFNQIFNESSTTNNINSHGELSISNGSGKDTPETSNITAIAESNSDGNSKMKDAETQLEAQYHAGDKDRERESGHEAGVGMVGGMMQALGLGHPNSTQQHSHSHSRNHENGNLSPNRSSYSQSHPTTRERERSNSERKYLDSTMESGRRSSLNPPPNLTRSHSSTNSILQSSEIVSSNSNEFTPMFQFFTSDGSPVVGISILNSTLRDSSSGEDSTLEKETKENGDEAQDQQREPSNMIVLQESGTLSNWSLEDGNLISSLNLSNIDLYQEEKSSLSTASIVTGSGNLLSVPSTSNGQGQGAIASTIAALRSTANATPLGGRSRSGSDAAANSKDPKQSNSTSGNRSTSSKSGGSTATKFVNLEKLLVRRKPQDFDADVEEEDELLLAFDSLNSRICLLKVDTRPRIEDSPQLIKSIRLENPKSNVIPSGSISKSIDGKFQFRVLYIDSSDHLQSITVPITTSLQDQERDEVKSQSSNPTSFASHLNSKLTTQSLNSSPKIKPTSLSSEVPPSSSSRPTTPSVTSSDRRFDFHLPFQKNSLVDKQTPQVSQEVETIQIRDLGKIDKTSRIGKVLGFEVDEKNDMVWIWSKKKLLVARLLEESFEKVALATSDFSRLSSVRSLVGDGKKVLLQFDDSIRIATLTSDSSIVINDFFDSSCVDACSVSDQEDSYWVISEAGELKICRKDTVEQTKSSVVYRSSSPPEERKLATQKEVSVVSVLPLSLERVVVAFSTGQLVLSPLLDLVTQRTYQKEIVSPDSDFRSENSSRYQGTISLLQLVTNVRTSSKHIVGGTEEGDLMIWDSTTLNLQAEWSLFTSPVTTLVPFGPTDNAIRLHGCVLVISSDGTVAIIVLDGLKLLSMIPGRGNGTGSRLEKVAVRADDLLLIYDDEKARVWDTRSQELRRSIGLDQALSLLEDGKGSWSQFQVDPTVSRREKGSSGVLSVIPSARGFSSTTVLADMRRAIEAASKAVHPSIPSGSVRGAPSNQSVQVEDSLAPPPPDAFMTIGRNAINSSNRSKASPAGAKKAFTILKPLLSALLPSCALTSTSQDNVTKLIGNDSPGSIPSFGTFSSPGFLARAVVSSPSDIWSISTSMTTDLLLSMVSMLGVISHIQEFESAATSIIAFLVIDLPEVIGEIYQPASLPTLASYFMDSNVEIQHASRALFASALDRLSQTEIDTLCEAWHDSLPSKSTSPEETRPLALSLLGLIAAERYKMLSPALLKDIASSISLYIDDENRPMHQALAIELCCRGFSTWQHYLDAMEVVRSLFALSTSKESGAIAENRALARQATLQIAADNTPLFMTTLSLDILHARSPAHCSATMRLVAFMVRRKPLILYPNLPRLAEAVVKSLDPTNTVFRESVVQAATVMISELVSCYPSIAFHGKLQRLAVGTHEGAIIMYDLKTATRLYVLEGHRNSLSGLEFAGDGRRLVSISLEESRALIWKVGNSFTGLFNPGIMPRQGGSDPSGAYKAIDFNIGEAGSLSPSEALEAVSFEWQNDRSVKLNVGQASMNFNVA